MNLIGKLIYVAAYCPSTATPDGGGAFGGFEWYTTEGEAVQTLMRWITGDPLLASDYVLRALTIPDDVENTNEAVSEWLDDSRELWETRSQTHAQRPE